MLKKILLPISAIATMSLVACGDSDSSSSGSSSDKATCKVVKDEKNLFQIAISVPDSGSFSYKVSNDKDGISYVTIVDLDKSISEKEFQKACEEMKADEEDDVVTCKDHHMEISSSMGPEFSEFFGEFVNELQEMCDKVEKYGIKNDDDDDDDDDIKSSSSTGSKDPSSSSSNDDPNKITCKVDQNTSEMVQVTITVPDSATVVYKVVYPADSAMTLETVTFDKSISEKDVQSACEEYKADLDEEDATVLTCKDRTITAYSKIEDELSAAFLPMYGMALISSCYEIQETGKLPEDDEDDDDDDDDNGNSNGGWDDEEGDTPIFSSSSDDDERPSSSESSEPATKTECSIDMKSNTWTIKNGGKKMIYEFDGDLLNYTTETTEDVGSEDMCLLYKDSFGGNGISGMDCSCNGNLLTITSSNTQENVNKEALYESLVKEYCSDN